MAGLFHSLNLGSESMYANRQGLDTTSHNIANAQTPGYSRQQVELTQRRPIQKGGVWIGNGVFVPSITRSHDQFTQRQLGQVKMSMQEHQARSDQLAQLESIFDPSLTTSIDSEVNGFFSALSTLSNFPEDLSARTALKEKGQSLAQAFQRVDQELKTARQGTDSKIFGTVEEINTILSRFSKLNSVISGMDAGKGVSQANDLHDERDKLLERLSELTVIHSYQDSHGMVTLRGPGDSLLVEGESFAQFSLQKNANNDGLYDILLNPSSESIPANLTQAIFSSPEKGGLLKGLLYVRDGHNKELIESNNEMARSFVETFNGVHAQGFGIGDFQNVQGTLFFKVSEDPSLAAQHMEVADRILNSTDAISAASSQGAIGDNINLTRLIQLKDHKFLAHNRANLTEYYANTVGKLGIEAQKAQHHLAADEILHRDWSAKQDALSGVSLDEEATNLIKWQTAFTASSKVITTVDEMLETVLNLKR